MNTHLLRIKGTVRIDDFWPAGKSDADTTKVILTPTHGFEVRLFGDQTFRPTHAYDNAYVRSGSRADGNFVRKRVIDDQGRITIRLQRVDAAELHYKPDTRGSGGGLAGQGLVVDYRQHQAETATVRLARHLATFGQTTVDVEFQSELPISGGPGEAIDKYGRFVGDLILPDGTNLNLWLLDQGLAILALYESMLDHEIDESVTAFQRGRSRSGVPVDAYSQRFLRFDPALRFRPPGSPVQSEGRRRFIHPKYFRRQATWYAFHRAGLFGGDFGDWLESKGEEVYYMPEFRQLRKRAPRYSLYDRASDGDGCGWGPDEFIFMEAPSTLWADDAQGRAVKVTGW